MSLLSSHRLHWGSHHELTDHFWIIVDHLVHPSTPDSASSQASALGADGTKPADASPPLDTNNTRLDALGP